MNKFLALASTAAMVGVTSLASMAPATAAPPMSRQQYVMNWCNSHRGDPSCNDFNRHGHRWSDNQYRGWYQSHRGNPGFSPLAAGIFGFAAGAIAGSIANSTHSSTHQQRCAAAYRSYNPRTDRYVYDSAGHTRVCRL